MISSLSSSNRWELEGYINDKGEIETVIGTNVEGRITHQASRGFRLVLTKGIDLVGKTPREDDDAIILFQRTFEEEIRALAKAKEA